MALAKFKSIVDNALNLMQTSWAAAIDPILNNPISKGSILNNVVLTSGSNTINHGLGRKLQGYIVILKSAAGTIYDSQSTNPIPNLTLRLVSSVDCTVSLYVF